MSHPGAMGSSKATFRFYAELNDFLPLDCRQRDATYSFHVAPSVKDAIESLGIPHVEVDIILVNGTSVGFEHRVAPHDRIAVYPMFEALDISPVTHLRARPLRRPPWPAHPIARRPKSGSRRDC